MDIKLDHPSPVEEKPPAVEEPHSVEDGMSSITFIHFTLSLQFTAGAVVVCRRVTLLWRPHP